MFLKSTKRLLLICTLITASLGAMNIHQVNATMISTAIPGSSNKAGQRNLNDKELTKVKDSLVNKINLERTSHNNIKLDKDSLLSKSATLRAKEIVTKYSHIRPNGKSFLTSLTSVGINSTRLNAGECLAKYTINAENSYNDTKLNQISNNIHRVLMNSSIHQSVILDKRYSKVNVGIYSQMKEGRVTLYIVEHFKNDNRKEITSLKISTPQTAIYTGKQIKPSVTLKDNTKLLKNGIDYTLSYEKNKSIGKATIKITGKGNYKGSVTKSFHIVPKTISTPTLKAGKKSISIKYKKVTGASGYQIAYSRNKSSGFKYVSTTSLSKVIGRLSSNKTYYIKVRAYKTVNKVNYYGGFSSLKSLKVK